MTFSQFVTSIFFIGLIASVVALFAAHRRQEGQHNRSGDALWDELRRAHGLSGQESRFLKEAAAAASVDPATAIFVDPQTLSRAASGDAHQIELRQRLSEKLFS